MATSRSRAAMIGARSFAHRARGSKAVPAARSKLTSPRTCRGGSPCETYEELRALPVRMRAADGFARNAVDGEEAPRRERHHPRPKPLRSPCFEKVVLIARIRSVGTMAKTFVPTVVPVTGVNPCLGFRLCGRAYAVYHFGDRDPIFGGS
jgi:hypothetical protein